MVRLSVLVDHSHRSIFSHRAPPLCRCLDPLRRLSNVTQRSRPHLVGRPTPLTWETHSNFDPHQFCNGALLQILAGSCFTDKIPKANAVIANNNRPTTEVVPYFEQFGPLVNQMMPIVEASPISSMARTASGDAWKVLIDAAGAILPDNDKESLNSLTRFVDQLPSVMNEVTQGISEFKPTPAENRDFFKNSYNVKHTLLVKFNFDGIDETDTLEETLQSRVEAIGGTLEKVEISGNHITPCIQGAQQRMSQQAPQQ